MSGESWFPQYLDDGITIVLLEADEMIPALIMFLGGVFLRQFWIGMVATVTYITILKRYKAKHPGGLILQLLYAVGLFDLPGYPNGLQTDFRE